MTAGANGEGLSETVREVRQAPRAAGHALQPKWKNPGSFKHRLAQLGPCFEGKSVLDVGCVSGIGRDDWIHAGIAEVAASVVGVDIDPIGIARAQALGFDVRAGDAERLYLDGTFEVVHAGELIEHLDNPRAFLAACRRRLAPDGVLVLTTPNPFAVANFVYRFGGNPRVNGDHVCWFCEDTLRQLLERNGYDIVEMSYLKHQTPGRFRPLVTKVVRGLFPERLAWNTLLVVAKASGEPA